jgi:hypothetical protein
MWIFDNSPYAIVILFCSISGLAMIFAGILFLYKGIITLTSTAPADAITMEYRQLVKISSQAPGIAFFIISGIFFVWAGYLAQHPPERMPPVQVIGKVTAISEAGAEVAVGEPVTISVSANKWPIDANGTEIEGEIHLDNTWLTFEISAPGYVVSKQAKKIDRIKGVVKLDEVKLVRKKTVEEINKNIDQNAETGRIVSNAPNRTFGY